MRFSVTYMTYTLVCDDHQERYPWPPPIRPESAVARRHNPFPVVNSESRPETYSKKAQAELGPRVEMAHAPRNFQSRLRCRPWASSQRQRGGGAVRCVTRWQ